MFRAILEKLLNYDNDKEEEIISVFESLDEGAAVDISGIEDNYV